jgi:glycosyltransferase involved in cell wall biosynthesis
MNDRRSPAVLLVAAVDIGAANAPAVHLLSIAQEMALQGLSVYLLTPPPSNKPVIDVTSVGVRVLSRPARHCVRMPNAARLLLLLPRLLSVVIRCRPQMVYSRFGLTSFLALIACRVVANCTLVSEHNGWVSEELRVLGVDDMICRLAARSQRYDARVAHKVRVVVPGIGERLHAAGIPETKTFVADNGTDLDRVRPVPRPAALATWRLEPQTRYIGFLGHLTVWQGLELAIEALRRVRDQRPDVDLIIAGDGPEQPRLQALAERWGVAPQVHFLGSVAPSQVGQFLSCVDVALAPKTTAISDIGFSPLKVRDYAAAGCPTVLPDLPGLRDLASGGWVELHRAHDPQDLARVLVEILDDPERRRAMSAASRRYAEAHFGWDKTVRVILSRAAIIPPA